MIKKKLAILSSIKFENKIMEDILLKKELMKFYDCEIIAWEKINKETVHLYSAFLIKSIWGYHRNYLKFIELIRYIKSCEIPIFNSYENIMFDISKKNQYSFLKSYNINTIPTFFLSDYSKMAKNKIFDCKQYIIKPAISASGENVIKTSKIDLTFLKQTYKDVLLDKNQDILIQPYINSVTKGEISCIVINDKLQYTVKRYTGVFTSEKSIKYNSTIESNIKEFVNPIINSLKKLELLFYRIDLMENNGNYLVVELEMIDPDLFIRNLPYEIQERAVKTIIDTLNYKIQIKDGMKL